MNRKLYPGFHLPADSLSAYSFSIDTFVISLKDQTIITHTCADHVQFRLWLDSFGVRNVQEFPQEPKTGINQTESTSGDWLSYLLAWVPQSVRLFVSRCSQRLVAFTIKRYKLPAGNSFARKV